MAYEQFRAELRRYSTFVPFPFRYGPCLLPNTYLCLCLFANLVQFEKLNLILERKHCRLANFADKHTMISHHPWCSLLVQLGILTVDLPLQFALQPSFTAPCDLAFISVHRHHSSLKPERIEYRNPQSLIVVSFCACFFRSWGGDSIIPHVSICSISCLGHWISSALINRTDPDEDYRLHLILQLTWA
jgi:hypothetical protein